MVETTEFELEPLAPSGTLADRVTQILLKKIESGEFSPGTQLPTEQVMGQRFGVSRTVVREAVSRLKSEGLVETRRGSGAFVRERNGATPFRIDVDVRDSLGAVLRVIELRRCLEAEAAALAAERRSEAQLAQIKRALRAIQKSEEAGQEGVDEDLAFHSAIAQATGNPLYTSLLRFLGQFVHGAIRVTRTNEARREDFGRQVKMEHEAIFDAIARKDPAGARATAIHHLDNAARRLRAADKEFWASAGGEAARQLARSEAGEHATKKRRQPLPPA